MGNAFAYWTRTLPGWSVVGVVALLVSAFLLSPAGMTDRQHYGEATTSQIVLSVYTCLLHVLTMVFPARACWAIGDVMKRLKEAAGAGDRTKKRNKQVVKHAQASSTPTMHPSLVMVIMIPAYKEELETLEETLQVLANHAQAKNSYHIYLGMEEKEEGVACKASRLMTTFRGSFHRMSYTVHPCGIPGEAQGKSSNESWIAKQAFRDYPAETKRNVVMTTMDADTHLSFRYFEQVVKSHSENPATNQRTMYIPPLVFDRNIDDVPLPVRTADIIWAGAGISSLYHGSSVCIPTSVYSLPMTLVEKVGGWDTGPGAIGEDLHMYLKCFFALSGNLHTKVVYAAASSCNVSSDMKGLPGYLDGLRARYRQALRHMWGSLDTGYAVRQTCHMLRRHYLSCLPVCKSPATIGEVAYRARDILFAGMSTVCDPDWAALISPRPTTPKIVVTSPTTSPPTTSLPLHPIHKRNLLIIYQRLFEAHFLPIHLATILTVSMLHSLLASSPLPPALDLALQISNLCRWVGWTLMCLFFFRYQAYHRLCVRLRKEDEQQIRRRGGKGSSPARATQHEPAIAENLFGRFGVLEAALFPLGGFVFGAIPACQAVLCHLFTEKITYRVSLKPQMAVRALKGAAA